jgi:copper chaperone
MTTITVKGMSCEYCEQAVEEALQGISGVSDARADHEAENATIEGGPDSSAFVRATEDVVRRFGMNTAARRHCTTKSGRAI